MVGEAIGYLRVADVIDIGQEKARLPRRSRASRARSSSVDEKLGNADFIAKAKPEVIDEQRERREEWAAAQRKMSEALSRLASA